MKELLDENFFLNHQRESDLIRAVKVAAFPGDGRGVASRLRIGRKSVGKNTFNTVELPGMEESHSYPRSEES